MSSARISRTFGFSVDMSAAPLARRRLSRQGPGRLGSTDTASRASPMVGLRGAGRHHPHGVTPLRLSPWVPDGENFFSSYAWAHEVGTIDRTPSPSPQPEQRQGGSDNRSENRRSTGGPRPSRRPPTAPEKWKVGGSTRPAHKQSRRSGHAPGSAALFVSAVRPLAAVRDSRGEVGRGGLHLGQGRLDGRRLLPDVLDRQAVHRGLQGGEGRLDLVDVRLQRGRG